MFFLERIEVLPEEESLPHTEHGFLARVAPNMLAPRNT
jgi:hypothetical protein